MLTRLTDRIVEQDGGKKKKIARYGMWGTTSEIEKRSRKCFVVIHKNKQEKEFPSLEEAEQYLKERIGY